MINASLKELSAALAQRKISAVELATLFLNRIERLNPALNAFITTDREKTLAQAQRSPTRTSSAPLARQVRTSCASKMLDNFISPYDAHGGGAHARAGMVMLGKTNMDEFAMGSSNETSSSARSPTPGMYPRAGRLLRRLGGRESRRGSRRLATGTDTGGSIRQPAAFCGLISGIKPTYGVVSRYGMIAFASSLDQGGPMGQERRRPVR
jgi:aspartyl-tRNA(Asn)/glutamyl-tRNA(Gln) amidotransferase subunit A